MSKTIKGITIELDGNATKLNDAIKSVDSSTRKVQTELKQVNNLLKFDPSNTELLAQKQELLGKTIKNTEDRLKALKDAQAEVTRQFEAGEIGEEAFRKFQREIIATEGKLKAFKAQAEAVDVKIKSDVDVSGLDKAVQKLEELGKKAEEIGGKMSELGESMTQNISAPIAAMGTAAVLSAGQFDNALGQIEAALGVTGAEAENLEETAKAVWSEGFGDSLEDVTGALVRVKQNMKNITGDELENVTRNALALAKTMDADVNEVTRAANNLMTNFGIDSEKAFDMMAKGAQNGLNFSDELFDNISEYAPLWKDAGFSAEEMFGILQAGTEQGVYNLDYLNDVVKEFGVRIVDGSESTSTAMAGTLASTQEVFDAFQSGKATVADVAKAVAADLSTMENDVDRNAIGVALFGTKWEDLGGDVVLSMLNAGQAMTDFEGSMSGIVQAQEQTFGQRWDSLVRNAAVSLEPVGTILLELAENWLPKVAAVLEKVATWFSNLSPLTQGLIIGIGGIVAALGPFLAILGPIITSFSSVIGVVTKVITSFGGFQAVLTALSGPVGIAIGAISLLISIAAVIYKNWDEISKFLSNVWNSISANASKIFNGIFSIISKVWSNLKSTTSDVTKNIMNAVSNAWSSIKNSTSSIFSNVLSVASSVWNNIKNTVAKVASGIFSAISSSFNNVKNTTSSIFSQVKGLITNPVEQAKNAVQKAVNNIKSFFSSMKLKIPNIQLPKLPKFKLTGSFSLNPPSVPKLSVSWNADGGIFKKPTIFNTANAGLQGVGEAGKEAIIPLKPSVLAGIGRGIAEQMNVGQSTNIPSTIVVQSVLDGRIVAQSITPFVSVKQQSDANLSALAKGVRL